MSRRLTQTDVNHGTLKPYDGGLPPKEVAQKNDDGFSFLTPARYIDLRLEDQLNYYSNKTPKLEKQVKQMQVAILVAGGAGTLLAAVHAELWVALTTALATALTAGSPPASQTKR